MPPLPISSRFSRAASITAAVCAVAGVLLLRSSTSSIACINPMPRTSPMISCFSCNSSSCAAQISRRFRPQLLQQVLLVDEIDHRFGCSRRHRVAAERRDRQPFDRIGDLRTFATVSPIGAPLPRPLALVMMSGVTPHCSMPNHLLAGASPSGLHFVADEDAAVIAHDFRDDREIFLRRRDKAADALNRLGDEARDAARWSSCGSAPPCPART